MLQIGYELYKKSMYYITKGKYAELIQIINETMPCDEKE